MENLVGKVVVFFDEDAPYYGYVKSKDDDVYMVVFNYECGRTARYLTADEITVSADITVPTIENIHQAVYNQASQPDALNMENWHTCTNTHCWAGWAVQLAGPQGKQLESLIGTPNAALAIYQASANYSMDEGNFYIPNHKALPKMQALAENVP